jgi:hypothetical protein
VSVNGDPIRTRELSAAVVAWDTFPSEDGFDYVVMSDADGAVLVFDAFYVSFERPILMVSVETPISGEVLAITL